MASSNYNVHLSFTADANAARAQIKSLQQELNKLATGKTLSTSMAELSPEIQKATQSAAELQAKLENAVNVNTGKLDLGKFSSSLKSSGKTLQDYANELSALGPKGQEAFIALAQSVVAAETPIIRCSDHLKKMGVAISNAAKWQLSSSVIHGLTGAVQSAYGYAQDLNESLNNIRIVTGQNIEQMDRFAEKANKAAKALSTTTLDYTNASLIYYQQGLTDQEVADRTEITIKMANAAAESAETVSDQLTAVWNNFYDGSKSLEYYADVMTALGAATASSTSEISEGLEKFASVAETVGLSYEYATAALATVTATTRQSADVVGTAFKTLFARLQDLELGETLDDGTTLGQYSEALYKVGINIKDTNGEMKDMDDILDELGSKWDTLSKSTQVALAQTVAGTRQYTQLVSLMDNWDYFQENLGVANSSSGALQEQADIYAESWEAARDRVTASAEAIYDKLISDKAFILMLDGVSDVIDGISSLIDALGGLKGTLFTIGSIVSTLFKDEITKGIYNLSSTIVALTPVGTQQRKQSKQEAIDALYSIHSKEGGATGEAENLALDHEKAMQSYLVENESKLTKEQLTQVQLQMDLVRQMDKRAISAAKQADLAKKETEELMSQLTLRKKLEATRKVNEDRKDDVDKVNNLNEKRQQFIESGDKMNDQGYISWRKNKVQSTAEERVTTIRNQIAGIGTMRDSEEEKNMKKDTFGEAKQIVKANKGDPEDMSLVAAKYMELLEEKASDGDGVAAKLRDAILYGAKAGTDEYLDSLDSEIQTLRTSIDADIDQAHARIDAERATVEQLVDKAASAAASATMLSQAASGVTISKDQKEMSQSENIKRDQQVYEQLKSKIDAVKQSLKGLKQTDSVKAQIKAADEWEKALADADEKAKALLDPETEDGVTALADYEAAVKRVQEAIKKMAAGDGMLTAGQAAAAALTAETAEVANYGEGIEAYVTAAYREKVAKGTSDNAQKDTQTPLGNIGNFGSGADGMQDFASSITNVTQAIMSLGSVITAVQSAVDTFSDPDASGWDKFTAVIGVVAAGIPAVTGLMSAFGVQATATGIQVNAAIWPITLTLLAIAAALAGLGYWLSAITTESEKAAKAQEQAAEDATTAANALSDAKTAYEDLKDAIEDYASAKNGIDKLIEGTEEFSEAVANANEKARELMDTYGLAGTYNADTGLWEISDEEIRRAEEASQQKVKDAEINNSVAQSNLKSANNYKSMADAASQNDQVAGDIVGSVITGMASGAMIGAAVGSVVPVLGNIALGVIGAIGGLAAGIATWAAASDQREEQNRQQIAALEQLSDNYTNASGDYQTAYNMLSESEKALIDALGMTSDEIASLCSEVAANTAAIRQENKAIVDNYFGDNSTYANSKNKNALSNVLASELEDTQKEIYEEKYRDLKTKDLRQQYQDAFGYAGVKEDGDGVSSYFDAATNEWISISDEVARQALAQKEALGQLETNLVTLNNDLTTLNSTGASSAQKAFAVTAAGDSFMDIDEQILKDLTANGELTAENFNAEALGIDEANFDAIWKSAGYQSADAYREALNNMSGSIEQTFKNIAAGYSDSVSGELNKLHDNNNYTVNEFNAIASALDNVYTIAGNDAVADLGEAFNKAGEDADVLAAALASVTDWTDPNAINDLNKALKEQGIDVSSLGTEWDSFCQSMVDASTNVYTLINALEDLRGTIKSIKSITGDLSFGDVISDEDYQTLLSYNSALADMFTMTYDGWKFVGDKNALSEALQGSYGNLSEMKEKLAESRDAGSHLGKFAKNYSLLDDEGNLDINVGESGIDHLSQVYAAVASGQIDSAIETSSMNKDTLAEMYNTLSDVNADKTSEAYKTALANYASFVADLESYYADYQNGVFEDARGEELWVNSTVDSINELDALLANGTITAETFNKTLESVFKEQAENEGFDFEEVSDYAYALMASADAMVETREEAARLAIAQKKMDRGMTTLVETYEDWNEALESEDLVAKSKALAKLRDGMSDLTDVDMSKLPASFFETETNAKLLEQAINGDTEALRLLMGEAVKENALQMGLSPDAYSTLQTAIDDTINAINVQDLEVGATLNDAGMYEAFQQLLDSGAVTVEQMNDILSGIGFSPVIEYKKMSLGEAKRLNQKSYIKTADGQYSEVTSEMNLQDNAEVWVPVINADETSVKAPPSPSVTSNNSGGGGGSNKTIDITKKSDVVDRYKEINDSLDDNSQAMDRASKAADRLYGASRLKQMKKVNDLIQDEIKLNKTKREEALAYLATDKADLLDAASKAGLSFTFDEDGDITNYTEQMTKLYDQLHAAETSAMADNNVTDSEQEKIDAIQEKIDAVTDAISQYEETKGVVEDLDDEIQEAIYEWQDNNLEMLQYELELKITANDEELELIEYYLNKVEGDVYKIAEAWDLIGSKMDIAEENLGYYGDAAAEVYEKFQSGELSQDGAQEELSELRSNILNELTTLQELDAEKLAYYGNVLGLVSEELSEQTSKFDDLNTTLDHYKTLMDLTGNSKSYTDMKKILSTQADVQKNQADIAKREYEMYAAEVEDYKAKMEAAQAAGDTAAYELYKENYEAAYGYMVEAQDNMYSTTEAWLETMKELYQTQLEEIGKTLEESLTGGTSFDELTTAMERSASLQEEYLTTTNQIYETNKLMQQAQQEIDKTTNSVAKKKLAAYIQETEQLQNQGKLSNYELEIQQAKYDLLLAEIALEEAQSAKSTVRLQRDSEGNLGYVYTADSDKIADAEQELADKQNALYNIGLEGANEYSEKYAQTMQDMYETLSDLHTKYLEGEFASEDEYNNAVAAAKEYYYQKLEDYSSLYSVALTTDSRVVKDAWSSDYNDMMYKVEELKDSVEDYLTESKGVIEQWAQDVAYALEESGLDDMDTAIDEIKDASNELKEAITGEDGLLDAMDKQIEIANNVTSEYALQRGTVQGLIEDYENLITQIGDWKDAIIAANKEAAESYTNLNVAAGQASGYYNNVGNTSGGSGGSGSGGTATYGGSGSSYDSDVATIQQHLNTYHSTKLDVDGIWGPKTLQACKDKLGGSSTISAALDYIKKKCSHGGGGGGAAGLRNGLSNQFAYVSMYDTGGYTGSWGSYGKLAMLHEKELVLNAQDTENFLASMEVLDHILEVIDLQSASARIGGMLTSPTVGNSESVVEQHVEITANFPNATDHSEIEEAFNNLINQASQFANRK